MDLDVGGLKFDIEANLKKFDKDLRSANTKAGKFGAKIADGISTAKAGVTRLVKALAKVTAALTTIAAIGLGKLTKDIISASSAMEQWRTQIRVLVKDQEKSNALIADLMDFADRTPFMTSEIVDAGKQMLAFGFEAEEVKELLRDAGNLAAGMGKEIDMIAGAFGRIRAGDFGESMEILRRAGISKDALKAQGLTFSAGGQFEGTWEEMMAGVQAVIKERFPGMMKEMAGTFKGMLSTLQSKWELFKIAIGESGFLENVKSVLREILALVEKWKSEGKLEKWAQNISDWLSQGLKGVTDIIEALTGIDVGKDITGSIIYDEEAIKGVTESLDELYNQRKIMEDMINVQGKGAGPSWMVEDLNNITARIEEVKVERDRLFEGENTVKTPPWAQSIVDAIEWVKERMKNEDFGSVIGEALAVAMTSESVKAAAENLGFTIGDGILQGIINALKNLAAKLNQIIADAQSGFYLKWQKEHGNYVPGESYEDYQERNFGKTQMDSNMSVQFSE